MLLFVLSSPYTLTNAAFPAPGQNRAKKFPSSLCLPLSCFQNTLKSPPPGYNNPARVATPSEVHS